MIGTLISLFSKSIKRHLERPLGPNWAFLSSVDGSLYSTVRLTKLSAVTWLVTGAMANIPIHTSLSFVGQCQALPAVQVLKATDVAMLLLHRTAASLIRVKRSAGSVPNSLG